MSVLAILIPPRPRLSSRAAGDAPAAAAGWRYVLSPDGLQLTDQGVASSRQLPQADTVVAVLADADVSWQRVTLPKAPASRMRAALIGLLEEQLLEDEATLHFALEPQIAAGQPAWVAVVNKPWLQAELDGLEKAGVSVDRIVPSSWPGDAPQGHFFEAAPGADGATPVMLAFADESGRILLGLDGSLARQMLPTMSAQPVRWTASPAVAAPAERWLGAPVAVLGDGERALQAARSLWNLRQFDLAVRHRGAVALREALRRFMGPGWRPVRIGLVALAVLQIVGINAWAWHQQRAIERLQGQQAELLRATFPKVRTILDAPQQMRRETEQLRAGAGRAGESDLETLLAAAASAWPPGQGPLQTLRFTPGQISFTAAGWREEQITQFRDRLRPGGWSVESADGRLTLQRAKDGKA